MAEPFLGEIRMFGFGYPPRGWAKCDGQLLSIPHNEALYLIIGTTYGGDGETTFALPDLRGRSPLHDTAPYGAKGGAETVGLNEATTPAHTHPLRASTGNAASSDPSGKVLARSATPAYRNAADGLTDMRSSAVQSIGGEAHTNMQPSLTVGFCIAVQGTFPTE